MKKSFSYLMATAILVTSVSTTLAFAKNDEKYFDAQILVEFNTKDTETVKNKIKNKLNLKKFESKKKYKIGTSEINLIEIEASNVEEILSSLRNEPSIKYVEKNSVVSIEKKKDKPVEPPVEPPVEENDISDFISREYFNLQWGLQNVGQVINGVSGTSGIDTNATEGWKIELGSSNVVVGVMDTGVDINHPDLTKNLWTNQNEIPNNNIDDDNNGYIDDVNGWDFYNEDNSVFDSISSDSHGTHVAGIIASNGKTVGIAPNIKYAPIKFIDGDNGYISDAIEAIQYAQNVGIEIINCSFTTFDNNEALKSAMSNSNILFVCAAGNYGSDISKNPVYPAGYDIDNVLSVASINSKGELSSFSNYGRKVDLVAPGENIYSTLPNSTYGFMDGTSMASPFVTGVAGLLKSKNSEYTSIDLANSIKSNVKEVNSIKRKVGSNGILDSSKVLSN